MLFHVTQVHTPATCPVGDGGSNSLFDATVDGVRLIGRYGANAEHTMYYIVGPTTGRRCTASCCRASSGRPAPSPPSVKKRFSTDRGRGRPRSGATDT